MQFFDLGKEARFSELRHVETILGNVAGGDVSVACWEAGQTSPYHCHPEATEIYFCMSGGGIVRTEEGDVPVRPGCFVLHPPGELHEYVNGAERSILLRVRYGPAMYSRTMSWRRNPDWREAPEDRDYFAARRAESPSGAAE